MSAELVGFDPAWLRDPLWLLVQVLAVYRLTRLLTRDSVPPLPRVRDAIRTFAYRRWRRRHPTVGVDRVRDVYEDEPPLSTLIECPWCLGWWVSVVVTAAATLLPGLWWYAAVPLALSAAVGVTSELVERGE